MCGFRAGSVALQIVAVGLLVVACGGGGGPNGVELQALAPVEITYEDTYFGEGTVLGEPGVLTAFLRDGGDPVLADAQITNEGAVVAEYLADAGLFIIDVPPGQEAEFIVALSSPPVTELEDVAPSVATAPFSSGAPTVRAFENCEYPGHTAAVEAIVRSVIEQTPTTVHECQDAIIDGGNVHSQFFGGISSAPKPLIYNVSWGPDKPASDPQNKWGGNYGDWEAPIRRTYDRSLRRFWTTCIRGALFLESLGFDFMVVFAVGNRGANLSSVLDDLVALFPKFIKERVVFVGATEYASTNYAALADGEDHFLYAESGRLDDSTHRRTSWAAPRVAGMLANVATKADVSLVDAMDACKKAAKLRSDRMLVETEAVACAKPVTLEIIFESANAICRDSADVQYFPNYLQVSSPKVSHTHTPSRTSVYTTHGDTRERVQFEARIGDDITLTTSGVFLDSRPPHNDDGIYVVWPFGSTGSALAKWTETTAQFCADDSPKAGEIKFTVPFPPGN